VLLIYVDEPAPMDKAKKHRALMAVGFAGGFSVDQADGRGGRASSQSGTPWIAGVDVDFTSRQAGHLCSRPQIEGAAVAVAQVGHMAMLQARDPAPEMSAGQGASHRNHVAGFSACSTAADGPQAVVVASGESRTTSATKHARLRPLCGMMLPRVPAVRHTEEGGLVSAKVWYDEGGAG
jgi:hypothetical protein